MPYIRGRIICQWILTLVLVGEQMRLLGLDWKCRKVERGCVSSLHCFAVGYADCDAGVSRLDVVTGAVVW